MKTADKSIRILIAEAYEIVRFGLTGLFKQQPDFSVIGEATSGKEVLSLATELIPDIILLDLSLHDECSQDCILQLKAISPKSKILIFTASEDNKQHLLSLRYGAIGIIQKSHTLELICKAVRTVYTSNELWVDKALTTEMWKQSLDVKRNIVPKPVSTIPQDETPDTLSPIVNEQTPINARLTPRELQIACLSSKGMSAKKIGEDLFISHKTVRNQLTNIFSKLNIKNQLELSINRDTIDLCSECHLNQKENCLVN